MASPSDPHLPEAASAMRQAASPAPATPALSAAAQAGFAALQARFEAGLSARWALIAQAGSDPARIAALHQLSGAAGSYGFDALGQAARAAESALQSGAPKVAEAALARLAALMPALMPAAETPTRGPTTAEPGPAHDEAADGGTFTPIAFATPTPHEPHRNR